MTTTTTSAVFRLFGSVDTTEPSEQMQEKARMFTFFFFNWHCDRHLQRAVQKKNRSLFQLVDNGCKKLQQNYGDAWRKYKPFMFVTLLSLAVVREAVHMHTLQQQRQQQQQSQHCHQDLLSALAEKFSDVNVASALGQLVAFLNKLDRQVQTMPFGFVCSTSDDDILPVVGKFCADKNRNNVHGSSAAKTCWLPLSLQETDGTLIVAVLNAMPELSERIRVEIQGGSTVRRGRLYIEKHSDGSVSAQWQPLTAELFLNFHALASQTPGDLTLKWMLKHKRDEFVATVSDRFGPTARVRSFLIRQPPSTTTENAA